MLGPTLSRILKIFKLKYYTCCRKMISCFCCRSLVFTISIWKFRSPVIRQGWTFLHKNERFEPGFQNFYLLKFFEEYSPATQADLYKAYNNVSFDIFAAHGRWNASEVKALIPGGSNKMSWILSPIAVFRLYHDNPQGASGCLRVLLQLHEHRLQAQHGHKRVRDGSSSQECESYS